MRPLVARVHAFADLRERLGEPVRQYSPDGRLRWSRARSVAVAQVVADYFDMDENDPAAW
ncbi:hypothetical protein SAMN05421763_11727 [[Luteovulum] sphaeroides subsp. megalophilum]|uniref:hypothetical protein n=1 Tax=Cereibacter sphaeroides TaxID=1063 RepID=UPI0002A3088B|nr:hypothetical protein [Cereibacter sphaeroides]EKX56461.1 hypothetical protein D516_2973 [Rhodobacter sp. AKP1]SNT42290.1 hypothetical protein SAMN05421763_11727 [[Luteovulum] sphaeroides subsp. megalophilum]